MQLFNTLSRYGPTMWLQSLTTSPPRLFTLLSLALIFAIVLLTGFVLANFFRTSILDREAQMIGDFVQAHVARVISLSDLQKRDNPAARQRIADSFSAIENLSQVVRMRVFNRAGELVWSDDPDALDTETVHESSVREALRSGSQVVFYSIEGYASVSEQMPSTEVVEFYVPFTVKSGNSSVPGGVLALYRSAASLNYQIRRGILLQWLVTGGGGLVLYLALFALFNSVYRRQQKVEDQFSRLSSEHGRIVQMEKLSAMGTMIGEIAHQINNPLVGVLNLTQLAERKTDDPERVRELLGEIRRAGTHCRSFVQRMLDFTPIAKLERRPTVLIRLIHDTVALLRQSDASHPKIDVKIPEESATLEVDQILLRHAVFNLLHNAAQSDPEGPIEVCLERAEEPDGDRTGWSITVCDHGPGIAAGNEQNIFTPFFTTRDEGVGLGLPVVQHIATLHDGCVSGANHPQGGACFKLWLPEAQYSKEQMT